jgi:hypothetical protein
MTDYLKFGLEAISSMKIEAKKFWGHKNLQESHQFFFFNVESHQIE